MEQNEQHSWDDLCRWAEFGLITPEQFAELQQQRPRPLASRALAAFGAVGALIATLALGLLGVASAALVLSLTLFGLALIAARI